MINFGKRTSARRPTAGDQSRSGGTGWLNDLADFGSNPGALRAHSYVPAALRPGAALVVVLHGCLQTAAGYDHGAGWSTLADAHGFALLFPEQRRENNPNGCFNWFQPGDTRRGEGEVASIRSMITAMVAAHALDPGRVFVTGLSAGGAMAGAMLAAYPELFAGGAILAGLPVGAASNVAQAMAAMRGGDATVDAAALAARVLGASAHQGPWPRVSVWHGDADQVVASVNADAVVAQWRAMHGLGVAPSRIERAHGREHRVWRDAGGRDAVEQWTIAGIGHGAPIAADGAPGGGAAMPYMLDVGLASTRHIAAFWGLVPESATRQPAPRQPAPAPRQLGSTPPAGKRPARVLTPEPLGASGRTAATGIAKAIEDALRVAGLMK